MIWVAIIRLRQDHIHCQISFIGHYLHQYYCVNGLKEYYIKDEALDAGVKPAR